MVCVWDNDVLLSLGESQFFRRNTLPQAQSISDFNNRKSNLARCRILEIGLSFSGRIRTCIHVHVQVKRTISFRVECG